VRRGLAPVRVRVALHLVHSLLRGRANLVHLALRFGSQIVELGAC
jgi:hypothetical protein